MVRKSYTPEQIINKMREAEVYVNPSAVDLSGAGRFPQTLMRNGTRPVTMFLTASVFNVVGMALVPEEVSCSALLV